METLLDLASSIDSAAKSFNENDNGLCLIVLFVLIYGVAFAMSVVPCAALALLNNSAKHLPVRRDRWAPLGAFYALLTALFVVMAAPVALTVLRAGFAGCSIAVWIMAFDYAAGLYHGLFIGKTIAEYRRLPTPSDFVDDIVEGWH